MGPVGILDWPFCLIALRKIEGQKMAIGDSGHTILPENPY